MNFKNLKTFESFNPDDSIFVHDGDTVMVYLEKLVGFFAEHGISVDTEDVNAYDFYIKFPFTTNQMDGSLSSSTLSKIEDELSAMEGVEHVSVDLNKYFIDIEFEEKPELY